VSKNGNRKVIVGAQTYLMDYDETLEVLALSTGKPKTTDNLLKTVFLRVENNKISDLINVQTKDFVDVQVKVSYCVDFLEEYKDKWFSVENYVKYMTDRQRSLIKSEVKLHTIEDFYENAFDIIRKVALNISDDKSAGKDTIEGKVGRFFPENGMFVHDVEVLSVHIEEEVDDIINEHQMKIIEKTLELSNANKELEVSKKLAEVNNAMADLKYNTEFQKLTLENKLAKEKLEKGEEIARIKEASATAAKTAEEKLQPIMDSIQKSELARKKEITDAELSAKKDEDNLNMIKQKAYTDAIKKVMESFSPELIASMTSSANAELLQTVTQAMSPYAIANGESIAEVTNKLLRGTSLEKLIEHFNNDEK
jgi:major vault protein